MRLLVYWMVIPFTVLAVMASGWYVATGETPLDLFDHVTATPRIEMPMPPRIGPEKSSSSLLRPPAVNDPDVKMALESAKAPDPAPLPAAAGGPAAGSPPSPPVEPAPAAAPDATPAAHGDAVPGVATVTAPPPPPAMSEPLIPPGGEPLLPPSFSQLPSRSDLKALILGPLPELLKNTAAGALPISAGGKESRVVYARPFEGDRAMPRIAVVVAGLGLSKDATEAAITKLPPEVSLSFSPYAGNLDGWIKRARANGHEVLLDLPLEPPNFPVRDAGPLSVLARHTPVEAMSHLDQVLAKATSYVGLAGGLRSPVEASEQWVPILRSLRNRGLLFVGDGLVGVAEDDVPPSATVTLVADETPFRVAIDARLARLLAAAQRDGSAVTLASPRPVTFERLLAWFDTFPQRGVLLAPVSAVVRPQPDLSLHP